MLYTLCCYLATSFLELYKKTFIRQRKKVIWKWEFLNLIVSPVNPNSYSKKPSILLEDNNFKVYKNDDSYYAKFGDH